MFYRVRIISPDRARLNIMAIMATLTIPPDLIRTACLLTGREPFEAVCHVLSDYPRLISDLREARRRLLDIDQESENIDLVIEKLGHISRLINEL